MGGRARTHDRGQFDAKFGEREARLAPGFSSTPSSSFGTSEVVAKGASDLGSFSSTAIGTTLVQEQVDYPNLNNTFILMMVSGTKDIYDVTEPAYTMGNVASGVLGQTLTLASGTSRAQEFHNLYHQRNPAFLYMAHDKPMTALEAYEQTTSNFTRWKYKWLTRNDRRECILHYNANLWNVEMVGLATPSSGFGESRVGPNIMYEPWREWLSDAVTDQICGTSLASDPSLSRGEGLDCSDFMVWFHDSTTFQELRSSAKMERSQQNGLITAINVVSTKVVTCRIDSRPGSGVVDEAIFFFPNSGTTGFIGYVIQAYDTTFAPSGQADLTMVPLDGSNVEPSQDIVPAVGWRYSIANANSDTNSADWDTDGDAEGQLEASGIWIPQWYDYWAKTNAKVFAQTGNESGIGHNGIKKSFTHKESNGFTVPHPMTEKQDYPLCEAASNPVAEVIGTDQYEVGNQDMNYLIRLLGFSQTFVKSTPNSFMINKPRGVIWEHEVQNSFSTPYDNFTSLHRELCRWWWAICAVTPKLQYCAVGSSNSRHSFLMEECWLDLDTNFTGYVPWFTYDEDGGGAAPEGWYHTATFHAADWGERGYWRRVGNTLIIWNMCDVPPGYGTIYDPTTTPRNPEDTILPANWATLYTDGILAGDEVLYRYDFSSYRNLRSEAYYQNEQPNWSGYQFGPQQATPWDASVTNPLPTCPGIGRDPTINNGTLVNQGANLGIGFMQALALEIRKV